MARRKKRTKREKVSKESFKKSLRILDFLKPFRVKYFVGTIFLILTSLTALVFPYAMGDLVDSANTGNTSNLNTNNVVLLLLVILIAQSVFSFFRIYLFADVTESMLAMLRQKVYSHLIKLPMDYFSKSRVGELNSRISSDIASLQETFTTTLAEFMRQFIIIIGGIAMLGMTSIKLTLFMLCVIPIVAISAVFFGRFIRKISKTVQDTIAQSNTIVEETLQGITNVKAFANELLEITRYVKSTNEIKSMAMRGAKWRGAFASFIIFCLFGAIVGVIWYALILIENGEISHGDMFQFILLSVFVGASIGGIAELYAQIQKAIGCTERILDIMDEDTEKFEITNGIKSPVNGAIQFNSVNFHYPSRTDVEVLKHLSFEVKQGEKVAIVGPSGAGKTTISSLLLRFYNPQKGSVLIDEIDLNSFDLTYIRNQMAVVPQEILLFGGTLKENIAYGKPGATEAEIIEAIKLANAYDFIMDFPEKLETQVGERGIQLSGGQRQRVAIARAILKNPKILILDEATSSLDSASESKVQEAMEVLMKGRTSIIIAHRLSTIKNADKIIVLKDGKIAESGTHQELIAKNNGLYRELNEIQLS